MLYDEFEAKFRPQRNPYDPRASYDGCLFNECDPVQHSHVACTDPALVWTVLDCDGETVIASGYHYVNRMGYLICANPVPHNVFYEVTEDDHEYH